MVRKLSAVIVVLLAVALVPASPAAAQDRGDGTFSAGAPGIGDPYFPLDGNGGYDVLHYDLKLAYAAPDPVLTGVTTVVARATQDLSSFDLDLVGLDVDRVTVNGQRATWIRDGQELIITPRRGLRDGRRFTVRINYHGVPETFPDGSGPGWIATDDGALVVGEPHGATTWFPANDHPSDKATYTVHITVPDGVEAISNGRLTGTRTRHGLTTWNWSMRRPMASYLATATIGQFDLTRYRANGVRYLDAIDPDLLTPTVEPVTGSRFAFSQAAGPTFKRLTRTLTVPAEGAQVGFRVDRQTETDWDYFFVEARTVGGDDWTTLPDLAGHTTTDTGLSCPYWLGLHPFLTHYQAAGAEAGCVASGTTGSWSAASGDSDGYEAWSVDLSAFAGSEVELSLSYASDDEVQRRGVVVDDIAVSTGEGSTSFEDDGDTWDGWTVPGAPDGSAVNANDWVTAGAADVPTLGGVAQEAFAALPEIHAFEASLFGPYPFCDGGGIVDDYADLGFALENQTRPVYDRSFFGDAVDADSVVVHENAHQWFGDSVSVAGWKDIWLNEGFATYAEWLRIQAQGGPTTADILADFEAGIPADSPFWTVTIGDPGPAALFDVSVYVRGAMTLEVLRQAIGDEAFFRLLQTWTTTRAYGNGSIEDFTGLAEKVSGQQLDDLFRVWLFTAGKPETDAASARVAAVPLPWEGRTPVAVARR